MCDLGLPTQRSVTIRFTTSEAKAFLEDEIGTDAFELKVHRFRQKLRRALKEAEGQGHDHD